MNSLCCPPHAELPSTTVEHKLINKIRKLN